MRRLLLWLLPLALASSAGAVDAATPKAAPLPACHTTNLRLLRYGPVEVGLSHVGVRLIWRNIGPSCQVQGYPDVTGKWTAGVTTMHAKHTPYGYLGGPKKARLVRVATGHDVSALFEGLGAQPSGGPPCFPYSTLHIAPPSDKTSVQRGLPGGQRYCEPEVHPVVAGDSGGSAQPY